MKKIRGVGIVSLVLCLIMIVSINTVHLTARAEGIEPEVTWLSKNYDYVGDFVDGMAIVYLNDKLGFIDNTGKEVIAPKYDYANTFSEGLASVCLNDKWGFIDKKGKVVIPLKYAGKSFDSYFFREGLACVAENGDSFNLKYGFINKAGKVVVPLKYDYVEPFSDNLARVLLNGKLGFVDKTGKVVIPLKYDNGFSFSEDLACVSLNGKSGFIDKTGKVVIPLKYDNAFSFSNGLACVVLNNNASLIDKTGKLVIATKYNYIDTFSEGLAAVGLDNKWGFIDKTGKEVIPLKYDYINNFEGGRTKGSIITGSNAGDYKNNVLPSNDYTYSYIDKAGNEINVLKKYMFVGRVNEGLAYASYDGKKFGYIDVNYNEVIPFKSDIACDFNEGMAFVKKGNKLGIIKNPLTTIPIPKVAIVSLDHSPFVEGDNNEFYISAKGYTGQVQYQLFYIQESVMKEWKLIDNANMTNGWTNPIDAQTPINVDISSLNLKADKYRFAIRVRRVGVKGLKQNSYGDYDDAYPFNLNVVKDASIKLSDNINIEKTNFTKSENLVINGVGNLSKDIQYKLHLFDVKNSKWLTDLTEYNTDVNYSLKNISAGTYIVDLWAKNVDSKNKYDGWKLKVITITEK